MAVNILEKFNQALDEAIQAWIKLSDEWEKIEQTHSDKLSEKYPFNKDFREVISDLIEWKKQIK
ncbi:hypothetical protein P9G96_28210 [Bacillus paranthracis]|jgi:hypothetical protein|uniref:hypothetical protein n=1 Tax=Bacillus paranthracis TaxID=2026186 RepID=UPI00050295CD|nr:hypothetical protein [Bacillus paranthracis]KFL86306.1 hypothetical protein DJ51_5662 [Bacillus cereus]MEC2092466.1 hypothetical protein [Bacillus paranthracis]